MMPKKKKIVQPATATNKPKEPKPPAEAVKTAIETVEEPSKPEEQTEGIIEGTDKTPIPIDMIRKDLQPQEEKQSQPLLTLEAIAEKQATFEKDVETTLNSLIERLTPVIQFSDKLAEAQQQQQENPRSQQQNPMMGGFDIQSIMPFIQMLTGGGGGGDADFRELAKESMKADITFTKALKAAVISKITGGATSEIARAATGE